MELRIKDENQIVDTDFDKWLIPYIRVKIFASLGQYNLQQWDAYLTTSKNVPRLYDKTYSTREVIQFACQHLVCKGVPSEISIQFDNTQFVPGFDRLRLTTLVKTINYGTLDMNGCPIFSDVFTWFIENIDDYIKFYYRV